MQLGDLQKRYNEITELGAEVIAVSMDDLSETGQIVRRVGLMFPVLYSSGDARPPLAYSGLMDGGTHPFPGTYVIGKDGQIHYEFIGRNYIERAPTGDVIDVLRQLAD